MAIDHSLVPSARDYLGDMGLTLRHARGWRTCCPLCNFDSLTVRHERLSCEDCGFENLSVVAFHARFHGIDLAEAAQLLGCWKPDAVRPRPAP